MVGIFGIGGAFGSRNNALAVSLVSFLPDVAAARSLQAVARATAGARGVDHGIRTGPNTLEGQARLAKQRAADYGRLGFKLESTVKSVERGRDKLVGFKEILSDMRKQITLAQSTTIDDTQRRQHANEFDRLLGVLNTKARSGGSVGGNLIGNSLRDVFAADTLTYKTKPYSPVDHTVTGIFSGSDYQIVDGAGNVYLPDLYGSVLQQFPYVDGDEGELVSADDTVSFDPDTGAISITRAGESTPFLTGTLERKGLGVVHSFLYGNFTDAAKLDEALADLDAASAKLRFNISVIESELAKVTAHRDFNRRLVDDHNVLAVRVEETKRAEESVAGLEAQRRQLLFASTFQSTLSFDRTGGVLAIGAFSLFDFSV